MAAESRPIRVVTLPFNATEDRVVGGIDFERAIRTGERVIQPGLLARAHRGILGVKASKALAAYHGRTEVTDVDVQTSAELALPHRARRQPLMDVADNVQTVLRESA